MSISLFELAERSGATVGGDGSIQVSHVATLESAGPGAITFLTNLKYKKQLAATRATAVIVAPAMASETSLPKLVSPNPYATLAKVAAILHPPKPMEPGCHPSAVVDPAAHVAPSASIGPNAVIGAAAVIGARARIGAGSVVGLGASIGEDVLLHANVTVYDRCVVGPRSIVHSGAVIGADGFGMAEDSGRWLKIPQTGRVVIGADVEIGANTTIDRGAIDDTVIENDVKLDNLIQIGHNCRIGAHTAIAACAGIAGSTRIGKNCLIGGAAMLNGHIELCDGVVVSPGTGIMRSIDTPGVYSGFWPGMPHSQWKRIVLAAQGLRAIVARLRRLERATGSASDEGTADSGKGEA